MVQENYRPVALINTDKNLQLNIRKSSSATYKNTKRGFVNASSKTEGSN